MIIELLLRCCGPDVPDDARSTLLVKIIQSVLDMSGVYTLYRSVAQSQCVHKVGYVTSGNSESQSENLLSSVSVYLCHTLSHDFRQLETRQSQNDTSELHLTFAIIVLIISRWKDKPEPLKLTFALSPDRGTHTHRWNLHTARSSNLLLRSGWHVSWSCCKHTHCQTCKAVNNYHETFTGMFVWITFSNAAASSQSARLLFTCATFIFCALIITLEARKQKKSLLQKGHASAISVNHFNGCWHWYYYNGTYFLNNGCEWTPKSSLARKVLSAYVISVTAKRVGQEFL